MTLKNRVAIRDQLNFLLENFNRASSSRPQIAGLFEAAVKNHKGLAVCESWHGTYAFAELITDLMPAFARQNVKRFYTETVPANKQPLLDAWQDKGDDSDIVDYFDSQNFGFSKGMWQYYWRMLQAAKENNIRIVGIDKPDIHKSAEGKRHYTPRFLAPFKTMCFDDVIRADLAGAEAGTKFVVYCGEDHGTDFGGSLKSIHQHLDIPRMILKEGAFGIARHVFEAVPSFGIYLPPSPNQDIRDKERKIRTNSVRQPV